MKVNGRYRSAALHLIASLALMANVVHSPRLHAQLGDITIKSVTQTGRIDDGRIHFQVLGSFPGSADLRSRVICDGRPIPSAIENWGDTEMHVNLPVQSGSARCVFAFHRLTDGKESTPSPTAEIIVTGSPDQIRGSRDRGVTGGRHHVELYGAFPNHSILSATYGVTCNGASVSNVTIDYRTSSQLNVSFDEPPGQPSLDVGELPHWPPRARCTFVLGYGTGQRTNLWGPLDLRPNDALTGFGAYHWNTRTWIWPDVDDTLAVGQRPATRAGFDVVRVGMTPQQRQVAPGNRYKHNIDLFHTECPRGAPFLPCAARSDGYQRLFSSPGARVVVLTAVDSASWGDSGEDFYWRLLNPTWWTPENIAVVVKEYRDLALALYETQQNTGKIFIVANWETDHILACNNIAGFTTNSTTHTDCENDPIYNPNRVSGRLISWFSARKQGIQQAAAIAHARSITGVTVADGIEFNSVRWLQNSFLPCHDLGSTEPLPRCRSTLDDIIPVVRPAYASWSAWESIRDDFPGTAPNPTSMPGRSPRLDADLAALKARLGGIGTQLIIGEFGGEITFDFRDKTDAWIMGELARAVQRAELPVNVAWAAYDSIEDGEHRWYGLFSATGDERLAMVAVRDALIRGKAELSLPTLIQGIVVTAVPLDGTTSRSVRDLWLFPIAPQQCVWDQRNL